MKRSILLLLLVSAFVLAIASAALASDFCEGWHDGYIEGYCYQRFSCLPPIVPLCPLPRIGEDNYEDGYNRGFLAGLNARY